MKKTFSEFHHNNFITNWPEVEQFLSTEFPALKFSTMDPKSCNLQCQFK